jgi:SAM-dependent methyltransferase
VPSRPKARELADRIRPFVEQARSHSGWAFPKLAAKRVGPEIPWDYEAEARRVLESARSVLDMGTGGGEVFSRIVRGFEGRAVASEPWPPNVGVAKARLSPLRVSVIACDSLRLPLVANSMSVVLNRHEELEPREIARVLESRGTVLTQQVGQRNWKELQRFFPRRRDPKPLFDAYRREFQAAGLSVTRAEEHLTRVAYGGIGDVVYMLCVAPWEIADFSPLDTDLEALSVMERELATEDGIVLTEERFLIEAEKL